MPFKKGESGNPAGETEGVKLGKDMVRRFRADFGKHGIATIERLRKKSPGEYMRIASTLVPKQLHVDVRHDFSAVLQEASAMLEARRERDITPLEHTPVDGITSELRELREAPSPVERRGTGDDQEHE